MKMNLIKESENDINEIHQDESDQTECVQNETDLLNFIGIGRPLSFLGIFHYIIQFINYGILNKIVNI